MMKFLILVWTKGTHIGLFLALIGTFCASTGNMVHQRNLNNNFPSLQTIAFAMLYGSLVTFLITQVCGSELLFEYSFSYIVSLIYLSIFGSIFAFISYLKLLEKVGPGTSWICWSCNASSCFDNFNNI